MKLSEKIKKEPYYDPDGYMGMAGLKESHIEDSAEKVEDFGEEILDEEIEYMFGSLSEQTKEYIKEMVLDYEL